jgi:ArsR family transcriptional regulator, lead/cadmium/zinc/bismuth-responsive transcriptional repressor
VADEGCDLLCLDLPRAEAVRAQLPTDDRIGLAARRARAVADPTRLSVAMALASADELCGCDLAWILGRAQNLVSHHLRVLREADLVSSRREGKTVFYALTNPGRELIVAAARETVGTTT